MGPVRSWVVAVLGLAACVTDDASADTEADDDGSEAQEGGETPRGIEACYERYFSKISHECATIDCGEALTCEIEWDCLTCADRCEALPCSTDQDCIDGYGHLCTDVEWWCEPYITAEDTRCSPHAVGEPRCGDGQCSAAEDCQGCQEDCGYCPGTAPVMAPCTSDADCESGWCDDWCVGSCASGWDCVGDGTGTLYGDCVSATDGNWYCFPSCSLGADHCAIYPGTQCTTLPNLDGFDATVCSR